MTFSQIIDDIKRALTAYKYKWDKIDELAVDGLAGTVDSLAYKVDEIEKSIHTSEQIYGNNTWMTADYPVKFTVIGGDNAWGTELMLYAGDTIESGSASKTMALDYIYFSSDLDLLTENVVSNPVIIEFLYGTADTAITNVTTTILTNVFTKVGSGLVDGDKIIFNSVTTTTGLSADTVYYVIDVAGDNFKVSETIGGTEIDLKTGDGSCSISKLSQTSLTKTCVSYPTITNLSIPLRCPRIECDQRLFVRALSEPGITIAIGFLLGLHTYSA